LHSKLVYREIFMQITRQDSFKKVLFLELLILLFILNGCATNKAQVPISAIKKGSTDWVIMDPPLRSPRVTFPDPATGKDVTKAWVQLNNDQILKILTNTRSEISVGKFSANGTLTYLVAEVTAEKGTYEVIMDYTPYMVQDAIDPDSQKKIGDARVGVGLRLTAKVTTNKANINLGSLMALGVAANLGQLKGTMTVDTIGIRIAGGGGPIPSTTSIDETSILKTLEVLAVIQSKIADSTTHLDPQVIWVKPISSDIKKNDVAEPLKASL
jgi:hypothetical protein